MPRSRLSTRALVLAVMATVPFVGANESQAAAPPRVEAETMVVTPGAGQTFTDTAASGGAGLLVWSQGSASLNARTASGAQWLVVRARGDQCESAPAMRVAVDGVTVATVSVSSPTWTDHVVPGSWAAGSHRVEVSFINDHATSYCDRNLRLDHIAFSAASASLEAEAAPVSTGSGQAMLDPTASSRGALLLWSNGTADTRLAAPAGGQLVLRVRGDVCGEPPRMRVTLDGKQAVDVSVQTTTWTDVAVPGSWPGGTRRLQVSFTNDFAGNGCDRNLWLDRFEVRAALAASPVPTASPAPTASPSPTAPAPTDGNPFLGTKGYVDPHGSARREADRRRVWDPTGAAALDKVASGPHADWFGDWVPTASLSGVVDQRVSVQAVAGTLPVLVAYAIPHRDCGSYSAGGLADQAAYRSWIEQFARGIGTRPAVVVLEPDGLALMDCLTDAGRRERVAMLASAVDVFEALPAVAVYLDAGGAGWHSADDMAARLKAAGVARAQGFSLNVSNFADNATNLRYGSELSARVGGKHFIVDTSRNGLGSGSTWCNPEGRALGARFTTSTGSTLADAFTWIKAPGESDGTCGGGPAAGQWWTEYAVGLGQRTAW